MNMRLLVVSLALFLTGAVVAAAAAVPTLRLAGAGAIQGMHFKPHTTVRVAFAGTGAPKLLVRTTTAGTFTAALPASYDRCTSLTIVATAAGRTATLRVPPLPACLPASADGGATHIDG